MIRDRRTWEAFEAEWQRRNPPDLEVHFRIFDLQLARAINADVRLPAE
jgi:hypothetical protein